MKRRKVSEKRRERLLASYETSGMSAAAFARKNKIGYTTFCGWRTRAKSETGPRLVEVELPEQASEAGLLIELGGNCQFRINNSTQLPLGVQLLKELGVRAC